MQVILDKEQPQRIQPVLPKSAMDLWVTAIPPELTALIADDNNADTTQAKTSDNVTISLTYDMSINAPIIDMLFNTATAIADTTITYATVNDSSLNWTATYTVDSADTD